MKIPEVKLHKNTNELKLKKVRSMWNKHICVLIGDDIKPTDAERFFSHSSQCDHGMILLRYKTDIYLSQLMRDTGICGSISEAKGAGWHRKADNGFTDYHLDGLKVWKGTGFGIRPHRVTIFKSLKSKDK